MLVDKRNYNFFNYENGLKMGRFLKIAVYVAVLFLAYLWIATVAKSCNKKATADANNNTELIDGVADADTDEFENDLFEDEEGVDLDETATTDGMGGGNIIEQNESNGIDYTEVDEIIEKSSNSSATSTTKSYSTPTAKKTNSSYSGK
jgi:hypothetical protein